MNEFAREGRFAAMELRLRGEGLELRYKYASYRWRYGPLRLEGLAARFNDDLTGRSSCRKLAEV